MKTGESLLRPRRPFGVAWQNTLLLDGDGNASKISASRAHPGSAVAVAELRDWKELALFRKRLSGRATVFCAHAIVPSTPSNCIGVLGGEEEKRA
jgi:hypothetical protein